jgi:hypothetical protein
MSKERFKKAVLLLCADQGMTADETLQFVKEAGIFGPVDKTVGSAISAGSSGLWKALLAALMLPPVVGGLGGWGAGRLTAGMNDQTPLEIKNQEMIDEMERQTQAARVQTLLAQQRQQRGSQRGRSLL